ncbi:MAG: diaminopimelate epimerase [Saprospirales bacterium]|nr:MAG: diaminopimelate epimerase [Saprospirales bacterium]
MKKHFYKYHGAGNDFVLFSEDVFEDMNYDVLVKEIRFLCHRRFGVGADGVLLMKPIYSDNFAFEMVYYNSDGSRGSFCGNGSRCICRTAIELGWVKAGEEFDFLFGGKTYRGFSEDGIRISVNLVDVNDFGDCKEGFLVDTGSPHLILESNETDWKKLRKIAEGIRYSPPFSGNGVNVNFLRNTDKKAVDMVTYERGVEDFTYACGTGAVAAAVFLAEKTNKGGSFLLRSAGGELTVSLERQSLRRYTNVWLTGPAIKVFESDWHFGNSPHVVNLEKAENNSL